MLLTPLYARAIDDLIRSDLISQRDWFADCIFCSTLAVVIGCAMEVPEVLHELWPKLFAQERERLIKIVASIGLGFVVLGVAGELCFEHGRAGYEGLLQNFDNILLVDAERHAASAQKEAEDAAVEAGELGVKVDNLPSFVAKKESDITTELNSFQNFEKGVQNETATALERLKTDTETLNKARDDAKVAAKEAEAQRAAMEAANAPRQLSQQQQTNLISSMKGFGGLNVQILIPPSSSPDSGPLASLLESLLRQAEWKVGTMQTSVGWAKYVQICIGKTAKPKVTAAATSIVSAMREANIQALINNDLGPSIPASGSGVQIPNPDMTILVGSKT
jgi:hypothetical protein